MKSKEKNKILKITRDEFGTLSLIKNSILNPCDFLINQEQLLSLNNNINFMSGYMPKPFIFIPKDIVGVKKIKHGDICDLVLDDKIVGNIHVESKFKVKKDEAFKSIFSLNLLDNEIPGDIAISGTFEIENNEINKAKNRLDEIKKDLNLHKITALILNCDPLHRIHERLIRMTIDKADIVLIFLINSKDGNLLDFNIREKMLNFFIEKFLSRNRVFVIPIKDTFIFSNHQSPELECILAKNFGANKIVIGQNHGKIGAYFNQNQLHSILDEYKKLLNLEILIMPEFVYCNECKTIVSTKTCPHGHHHHVAYHNDTLRILLKEGILPPAIFIRKEISAFILSKMFPEKFENLSKIQMDLFPNNGIIEKKTLQDFYEDLMSLYQTTSLT